MSLGGVVPNNAKEPMALSENGTLTLAEVVAESQVEI